jgi:hypothetical protein
MKTSEWWLQRWKVQHNISQINTESGSGDNAASEQFPKTLNNVNDNGKSNSEQLYNCDKTVLANKSLDL